MTICKPRHALKDYEGKEVRETLNSVIAYSKTMHEAEKELVVRLYEIDRKRFYVRYGYKALVPFCVNCLKFTRTQSQRIVTAVRRYECGIPTVEIPQQMGPSGSQSELDRSKPEVDNLKPRVDRSRLGIGFIKKPEVF